ncbi:hypothetical protein GRI75_11135 [Altererythrobacter soli]|uniref:MAPEG family protein n=1 Tax=Croceibacterium soli TaxID=1739690 RepID=A0A6I4UX91_9SPHN|nr:MAPEG family protein [Croceibacterium soli]MXP42193.1 hypothetical protein [Croceibacterium soli]
MEAEILVLALAAVLLVAHIQLAIRFKTKQYGLGWNMGARDGEMPPPDPVVGRLERARDNFLETLPIAIIALFGVVLTGKASELTAACAWIWLAGRAIYLPLYWSGVKGWRSLAWAIATVAILVVLAILIFG